MARSRVDCPADDEAGPVDGPDPLQAAVRSAAACRCPAGPVERCRKAPCARLGSQLSQRHPLSDVVGHSGGKIDTESVSADWRAKPVRVNRAELPTVLR
jgi:hypothetical protein